MNHSIFRLIEYKFTLDILRILLDQDPTHYAGFLQQIEGITTVTLAKRLKMLVKAGVIYKRLAPGCPNRMTYSLTPLGRTLGPVVASLHTWETDHGAGLGEVS